MKSIEDKLNIIGFSGFVHLDPKKRDGEKRLVHHAFFNDFVILIQLIKKGNNWEIEKLDDNNIISNTLGKETSLTVQDLITFYKDFYYKESSLADYL